MVCRLFSLLGIPIYEADERAKWLTQHDPVLKADIVGLLGAAAYDASGTYDRGYVAAQVFSDPDLLAALNALVHPRVLADTNHWVARQSAPYVVKEAALMRAAGEGNDLDAVVVVIAPLPLRMARIRQRDPQRSDAEIRAIIDRQATDEQRLQLADYVVYNDETQLVIPQILLLNNQLRR